MKKAYTVPALHGSGNVVQETLGGVSLTGIENAPFTKASAPSAVGFYL